MAALLNLTETHTNMYRNGQVDALNGKVHWELVKQPDGSSSWQHKRTDNG